MTSIFGTFWTAYFLCIAAPIQTARILAIVPTPSYSHQIPYRPLWTALSRKGHEVVLITTDPINDPNLINLTEISIISNYKELRKFNFVKSLMEGNGIWLNILYEYKCVLNAVAENVYKHPKVRNMYVPDSEQKFDVVIAETFATPALYALAHRFNAPLIGVMSLGLYNTHHYMLGAPVLPSHPSSWEMNDETGVNLPFWQRIKNFIRLWYHIYFTINLFYSEQQAIAEKYLGRNIPDISDMERNISFVFFNQQVALSFVRPMTSNVLGVGNLHISKKLALPKNLEKFIAEAPNGFIYMSLGTNIMISSFPEYVQSIFRDVFGSLPYKVLWKHDGDLPNKTDNIYIAKWFPQQSILAHPNIRLFIYQGGLQSTEEAVYYRVPLLGLPIFCDQGAQVNKMVSLGVAKRLNVLDLSRESLNASITDIINDKRYKIKMLEVKALNEDKPYDILERVIWWIEFVIRHKGASHLRTSIAHDPWYRKHEMDIIAVSSIIIFILLFCTLIFIYRFLKETFNVMNLSIFIRVRTKEKTN